MSAFLLLALGITFSGFLLLCEHGYFRYLRKYLAHFRNTAWCNLISIGNLLERLAFRPLKMLCLDTVFENHRKSVIHHCERSELRLHFEWIIVH